MHTNPAAHDDFREQLSAWHDGALPDEASRFVLKRLLSDEALRSQVGRWQAVGDALRRERQQKPAGDIAARVAAALDAEAVASPAAADGSAVRRLDVRSGRAPALRWMATAAAVGVAAVLMWPTSSPETQDAAPTVIAAASPTPTVLPTRRDALARTATPVRRDTPAPLVAVAAPDAADPLIAGVPPLVRAPQPTPEQLAPLPAVEPLPAVDAPSRPWPRSGLGDAAYTVDYAVPATAPPSR